MARRAALEREVHRRMQRHQEEMLRQLPLLGSSARGFGSHTDGIRLARDGSLDASLELLDVHGRTSTVVLRSDPHGRVVETLPGAGAQTQTERPPRVGDETAERMDVVTALAQEHLPVGAA